MPDPHTDTQTLRLRGTGILDALDAIDDACEENSPTWEFLRAELTRSPSRGQRVSVLLTLIRRSAARRLHEERRASQRANNAE